MTRMLADREDDREMFVMTLLIYRQPGLLAPVIGMSKICPPSKGIARSSKGLARQRY